MFVDILSICIYLIFTLMPTEGAPEATAISAYSIWTSFPAQKPLQPWIIMIYTVPINNTVGTIPACDEKTVFTYF